MRHEVPGARFSADGGEGERRDLVKKSKICSVQTEFMARGIDLKPKRVWPTLAPSSIIPEP